MCSMCRRRTNSRLLPCGRRTAVALPQLLCVSSYGAGYDPIDVPSCTRAGVAVVNQSGGNAVSVAEHALGLILSVAHRITESDRRLRHERGFSREDLTGRELAGKTLGVVGAGNTGRRVAALGAAFGMTVLATDPFVAPDEIARRGARAVSLNELLAQCDIVSLHCPRDPSTLKMIDAGAYARMKRGVIFVAHGKGRHPRRTRAGPGAGLGSGRGGRPRCLGPGTAAAGPSSAALSDRGGHLSHRGRHHQRGATWRASRPSKIVSLLGGSRPPRLVNPEVWPAYATRFARILGRPVVG